MAQGTAKLSFWRIWGKNPPPKIQAGAVGLLVAPLPRFNPRPHADVD
jgi:hypothetical protein